MCGEASTRVPNDDVATATDDDSDDDDDDDVRKRFGGKVNDSLYFKTSQM